MGIEGNYFVVPDDYAAWFERSCVASDDGETSASKLFASWSLYVDAVGLPTKGSAKALSMFLRRIGYASHKVRRLGKIITVYKGLAVISAAQFAPKPVVVTDGNRNSVCVLTRACVREFTENELPSVTGYDGHVAEQSL